MKINIIEDEPIVTLTRSEYERWMQIYLQEIKTWYSVLPPPSFEKWYGNKVLHKYYDI